MLAVLLFTQPHTLLAEDQSYTYTWIPEHSDPNYHLPFENDFYTHGAAGQIRSLKMVYNESLRELAVELTLEAPTAPAILPKVISFTTRRAPAADGFLSRVTKLDAGRFATLYFDVSQPGSPKLSVYAFSGNENDYDDLSFFGRYVPSGVCPVDASCHEPIPGQVFVLPEQICTTEGNGNTCGDWVLSSFFAENGDGSATYQFSIRTGAIIDHVPAPYNAPVIPGEVWEGMQFNWEVGYLISALGYPGAMVSYNPEGFINAVNFEPIEDITRPVEKCFCFASDPVCPCGYQTLICGHDMKTVQPALCEVLEADSGELIIGQPFFAALRAESRGGNDLTVFYQGAPASMQFTPVDGFTQEGDILNTFGQREHPNYDIFYKQAPIPNELNSSLSYVAVEQDAGKTFAVDVTFVEARTNREFTCPVGFSVMSMPECDETNIQGIQFLLDSLSDEQANLVKRISRIYVRRARGTSQQKAARNFRKQTVARAAELNDANWNLVWGIPEVITQCEPSPICVQVSNVGTLEAFNENSLELRNLVRKTNRRMRRTLGFSNKNIVNQANALHEQMVLESATIPQSYDVCSDS
jgi:hypothetical protein